MGYMRLIPKISLDTHSKCEISMQAKHTRKQFKSIENQHIAPLSWFILMYVTQIGSPLEV